MIFFIYFLLSILLACRYFALLFLEKKKLFNFLFLCFYLVMALPLISPVIASLKQDISIKIVLFFLFVLGIVYSIWKQLQPSAANKIKFIWKKTVFLIGFFVVGFALIGINAMENLTNDKPILKIRLTGKKQMREMQWKNPDGPLQRAEIEYHEVVLQTIDDREIAHFFLPGELIALRARILRFHPLLNAVGIANRYRLDMAYTGYRQVENYRRFPLEAHPILTPSSFFNFFIFKYWESFFCKEAYSFWIKSAHLQSNYFPMIDEKGKAIESEFYLMISSSGLSASNTLLKRMN